MRTLTALLSIAILAGFSMLACASEPKTPLDDDHGPPPPEPPAKACQMDAKICSDGVTSVGRQGPNCEFAPCPGEKK